MAWFRKQPRKRHDYEREFLDEIFVHWEGLYRYARRLCGADALAEDLVQETLAKAFKAFERLRPGTNHRAWVYTILRNTFLSRARRMGRESPLADEAAVVDPLPRRADAALVQAADGYRHGFEDQVLGALDGLSEAQRSALVLCDIEGLSYEEISHVLDCPVGTVRSRIHHARRRMRATLSDYAQQLGYGHVQKNG